MKTSDRPTDLVPDVSDRHSLGIFETDSVDDCSSRKTVQVLFN